MFSLNSKLGAVEYFQGHNLYLITSHFTSFPLCEAYIIIARWLILWLTYGILLNWFPAWGLSCFCFFVVVHTKIPDQACGIINFSTLSWLNELPASFYAMRYKYMENEPSNYTKGTLFYIDPVFSRKPFKEAAGKGFDPLSEVQKSAFVKWDWCWPYLSNESNRIFYAPWVCL